MEKKKLRLAPILDSYKDSSYLKGFKSALCLRKYTTPIRRNEGISRFKKGNY